jgi:hypothetical protein
LRTPAERRVHRRFVSGLRRAEGFAGRGGYQRADWQRGHQSGALGEFLLGEHDVDDAPVSGALIDGEPVKKLN